MSSVNTPMSDSDIDNAVAEVLMDGLGLTEDEITDDAQLGIDLGAESIDVLDIHFRLEKALDIRMRRHELTDGLQEEDARKRLNLPDDADFDQIVESGDLKFALAMTVGDIRRTMKEVVRKTQQN